MSDLISRKAVLDIINRHRCDTARIEEGVINLPTAYDVDKDELVNVMAKTLLKTDFGRCALCDNYEKNITIDGINNGCDGNCRHDKEYTENDIINWFKKQLRGQKMKGAVKDE